MKPTVPIRQALTYPALLGNALTGDSWKPWRTLLIASLGEELTDDERQTFRQLTGREHEPGERIEELLAIIGRRGGKSRALSTLACYIAALCDHTDALAPGETGVSSHSARSAPGEDRSGLLRRRSRRRSELRQARRA